MTERKFYKTTYTVVVLSEHPIPGSWDLKDTLREAESGAFSGDVVSQETVEVDGKTMAELLIAQRSCTEFFNLTGNGDEYRDAEPQFGDY